MAAATGVQGGVSGGLVLTAAKSMLGHAETGAGVLGMLSATAHLTQVRF